jgi:protein CpxP
VKWNIIISAFLATLIGTSLVARAQNQPASPAPGQTAPADAPIRGGMRTSTQVVAQMDSRLKLSDDQKAKITPIIAARQDQIRAVMTDSSSGRFQKARKMKSIMSDSDKKIESLLTSDQQAGYRQFEQERRDEMRSRMQ